MHIYVTHHSMEHNPYVGQRLTVLPSSRQRKAVALQEKLIESEYNFTSLFWTQMCHTVYDSTWYAVTKSIRSYLILQNRWNGEPQNVNKKFKKYLCKLPHVHFLTIIWTSYKYITNYCCQHFTKFKWGMLKRLRNLTVARKLNWLNVKGRIKRSVEWILWNSND
jgi:hypothetical protein